jgi:hypothetical protein
MTGENGSVGFLHPDQCRYVEAIAAAAWGVEPEYGVQALSDEKER